MFQDVLPGGVAERATIRRGDILLAIEACFNRLRVTTRNDINRTLGLWKQPVFEQPAARLFRGRLKQTQAYNSPSGVMSSIQAACRVRLPDRQHRGLLMEFTGFGLKRMNPAFLSLIEPFS
ncbi:MAG TPA: hypothetical protein VGM27_23090 [Acidobacteriaceae bacterium]